MRTEMLRNNLRKATRAIQTHLNPTNPTNPTDFCKHPDFLALIDMAKNMNGAFRLTVSFPASFLKNRENNQRENNNHRKDNQRKNNGEDLNALDALKMLPLPVTIGKVQKITEATGNDEDMVTFDWFSTDNPEPDAETMKLISEFIGTMLEAMGIV